MKDPDTGDWAAVERMSLVDLRDRLVECLLDTKGEYFGRARAALGLDASEAAVRASAAGIVKLAFQTAGGSYDAPTFPVLVKVVNTMAERCLGWGVEPEHVFNYHCAQMRELGRIELMMSAETKQAKDGH
jgi:hypothetical protein